MMDELANDVIQTRCGGHVERCHKIRHHGSYSNAAHQWGAAMLMWHLWPEDFPRLGIYVLTHDVPEGIVGDIPAPALRHVEGMSESLKKIEARINHRHGLPAETDLSTEDYAKVKACDRLEFWIWCSEQVAMGNQYAYDAMGEMENYLSVSRMPAKAMDLFNALRARTVLPCQRGIIEEVIQEIKDGCE